MTVLLALIKLEKIPDTDEPENKDQNIPDDLDTIAFSPTTVASVAAVLPNKPIRNDIYIYHTDYNLRVMVSGSFSGILVVIFGIYGSFKISLITPLFLFFPTTIYAVIDIVKTN